eukprot:SAG31_NODE_8796_length_1385_cov_2.485226_1_plen_87_part_00
MVDDVEKHHPGFDVRYRRTVLCVLVYSYPPTMVGSLPTGQCGRGACPYAGTLLRRTYKCSLWTSKASGVGEYSGVLPRLFFFLGYR